MSEAEHQIKQVAAGVTAGLGAPSIRVGAYLVTVARLPALLRIPPHAHENATVNVVLDGHYQERLGNGPLQAHGPATLIAKPPGMVHMNQVGSTVTECLVVEVNADVALPFHTLVQRSSHVARCGGKLRAELVSMDNLSPLTIENLVVELLDGVSGSTLRSSDAGKPWLAQARDMLHDEPGPHSLTDLARRFGLHPIYLARAFRARFGCAVGEYARSLRVERARRMLHHTRLPLAEVAASAGYSDQSHMTRDFHRAFNCSPARYRKLAGKVPHFQDEIERAH